MYCYPYTTRLWCPVWTISYKPAIVAQPTPNCINTLVLKPTIQYIDIELQRALHVMALMRSLDYQPEHWPLSPLPRPHHLEEQEA